MNLTVRSLPEDILIPPMYLSEYAWGQRDLYFNMCSNARKVRYSTLDTVTFRDTVHNVYKEIESNATVQYCII